MSDKLTKDWQVLRINDYYSHNIIAPPSWAKALFKDICQIVGGSQPPKEYFINEPCEGYIQLIQIRDYKTDKFATYIPTELAKRFCSKEDIMIGRYGPPIFQILRGLEGAYNVALMKAEPNTQIVDKEFLYYFLQTSNLFNYIAAASLRTAGQDGVRKDHLDNYPVFVPPLNEQKRIVTQIEALRERSQKAKAALEVIPELCDRFRQSVLAAAFRGDLTADWREENHIFDEGFQSTVVTEYYLHEVVAPQSWHKCSFQDVCKVIGGSQPPKQHFIYEPRDGYVRLVQIRDYKSDQHATYIPIELAKRFCNKQDIMIGRYGPPIFQILRGLEGAYNVALMKAEPNPQKIDQEFLYYYLQNPNLYNYVAAGSLRTAGQDGVRKEHLNSYPFFLPSLKEQKEIVQKIQIYIKVIEIIQGQQQDKQHLLNRLNQSILAKAFRGELVEQDPNDEPASVLLDRIRAEREAQQPAKKSQRKGTAGQRKQGT